MTEQASPSRGAVRIDGSTLSIDKVVRVARMGASVELAPEARGRISESRASLERLLDGGSTVYAVNTGVGDLLDVRIPQDDLRTLQVNLL
ncbi:MAG TPA: aromatic amino acid lyase, partial [Thermoplasmata archaeon]|nr:aromatic amino acid lyase [Thermoplasmata archaeon]